MAVLILLLAVFLAVVGANDPGPLQDICVADLASTVKVNGFVCKDSADVTVNDFIYTGCTFQATPTMATGRERRRCS